VAADAAETWVSASSMSANSFVFLLSVGATVTRSSDSRSSTPCITFARAGGCRLASFITQPKSAFRSEKPSNADNAVSASSMPE